MTSIKLDLNYAYTDSKAVDNALQDAFDEAIRKKIREIEIIPGKKEHQLIKKIERFLQQPHVRENYHRMENENKKQGRLVIYFKY